MTTTPNLAITYIETQQSQKEVTANMAFQALDDALTEILLVSIEGGTATITTEQLTRAQFVRVTDAGSGITTVNVPNIKRLFVVLADQGNVGDVEITRGTTTALLAPGEVVLIYTDGTTNGLFVIAGSPTVSGTGTFVGLSDTPNSFTGHAGKQLRVNSGASALEFVAEPYDIGGTYLGKPAEETVLLHYPIPRAVTFLPDLAGSQGVALAESTAQTDFTILKNGVSFGTMRFAADSTVATFISASGATFAAGDVLSVVAPITPDATLASIGFSISGVR